MPWHAGLPAEIGDVDLGLGRRIDPHRTLERRVYPRSSATMQTAKLHGGCVLGSKTVGDNTAQLTRSPHFSSSSTDVPKGAAVTSSVLHDMPSLLLASYLALN